jgi:hypothetical protein
MGEAAGLYPSASVTLYPVFVNVPRSLVGNATPAAPPIWNGFDELCALATGAAAATLIAATKVGISSVIDDAETYTRWSTHLDP